MDRQALVALVVSVNDAAVVEVVQVVLVVLVRPMRQAVLVVLGNWSGGAGGEAAAVRTLAAARTRRLVVDNDFVPVRESFEDDTGIVRYAAFSGEANARPFADVCFELHPNRGFPMVPGTYDLAEIGTDFNTCQICVVNFRDFNFQTGARTMNLVANEGLVEITAIGDVNEAFQATLRGVKFKEASMHPGRHKIWS